MASSQSNTLLRAALLGAISGLRSMSGPALASYDASHNDRDLGDTPLAKLGSENVSTLLTLAAVGEMGVDKLPFIPNRTDPLPLLVRAILGGTAGAVVFVGAKQSVAAGAAVGALAAIVSSFLGFRLRAALSRRLPGPIAGLVGDALVVALGRAFLRA